MAQTQFVKIDSHAHLTSDQLYPHVDQLIERAITQGVKKMVNIATCKETLERGIELAKKYPGIIYNTAATTPHDVETQGESFFPLVQKAAKEEKLVAIGETGLDYYYEHSRRDLQKIFLQRYFELARRSGLNVVIHSRGDDVFNELFRMADEQPVRPKCLLHCFTGKAHHARQAIERGWHISISGIVTFKKSEDLREVVKEIPLEHLQIETDSPYLAPQRKRGQMNEPSYLEEVAEEIARIKGVSLEQVCAETSKNSCSFFQICDNI